MWSSDLFFLVCYGFYIISGVFETGMAKGEWERNTGAMAKRTVRSNGGSLISSSNHPTGCGEDLTDDTSTSNCVECRNVGIEGWSSCPDTSLSSIHIQRSGFNTATSMGGRGAQGLMKGTAPRCFYSACFSALGFFTFETTRVYLLMKHLEKKKITLEEKLDVKLTWIRFLIAKEEHLFHQRIQWDWSQFLY